VLLGRNVPGGFVPEEDEGYFLCSVTLPDAASLQRTTEVTRKLEALIASVPGVESVTIVDGNSTLTGTIAPNSATAFVQLKEWSHREHTSKQLMVQVNALIQSQLSEATAFAFGPPPIPGLGSSAGFSLMLQDLNTLERTMTTGDGTLFIEGRGLLKGSFALKATLGTRPLTLEGKFENAPVVSALD
jgi:HAE1 family hydrophobic/amphiphilic exporter-1